MYFHTQNLPESTALITYATVRSETEAVMKRTYACACVSRGILNTIVLYESKVSLTKKIEDGGPATIESIFTK